MSAIQTLNRQAAVQSSNVLNLDLRQEAAEVLRKSGKFSNVRVKYDARRNSLSLILRKASRSVQLDSTVLETTLGAAGFTSRVELSSGGPGAIESTYRVHTLSKFGAQVAKQAPVNKAAPKAKPAVQPTLTDALKNTQAGLTVSVALRGYFAGYVTEQTARQIEALIKADNTPKTKTLVLVNTTTAKKEPVELPYAVATAVEQKVPSFAHGDYTVNSTSGLTWVKYNGRMWIQE